MMSMNEDSILSEMSDELKELCTHPDPEQPIINEELKQQVIELEKKWICFYDESCRKASSEVVRNLMVKFNADREAFRTQLIEEMKIKLEKEKRDYDYKRSQSMNTELIKIVEEHERNISTTKKRQWCKVCLNEAIYACCWNTSYCSVECQGQHWPTHLRACRRNKE